MAIVRPGRLNRAFFILIHRGRRLRDFAQGQGCNPGNKVWCGVTVKTKTTPFSKKDYGSKLCQSGGDYELQFTKFQALGEELSSLIPHT